MANLGFKLAMQTAGIHVVETAVGDRYVLEDMNRGGYTLGGEQSGHVIMLEHATTGDGILTALQCSRGSRRPSRSLADLAAVMTRLPQVLINVDDVDQVARAHRRRAACKRWQVRSTNSAHRAGCCCGRAAPSQWCG